MWKKTASKMSITAHRLKNSIIFVHLYNILGKYEIRVRKFSLSMVG